MPWVHGWHHVTDFTSHPWGVGAPFGRIPAPASFAAFVERTAADAERTLRHSHNPILVARSTDKKTFDSSVILYDPRPRLYCRFQPQPTEFEEKFVTTTYPAASETRSVYAMDDCIRAGISRHVLALLKLETDKFWKNKDIQRTKSDILEWRESCQENAWRRRRHALAFYYKDEPLEDVSLPACFEEPDFDFDFYDVTKSGVYKPSPYDERQLIQIQYAYESLSYRIDTIKPIIKRMNGVKRFISTALCEHERFKDPSTCVQFLFPTNE